MPIGVVGIERGRETSHTSLEDTQLGSPASAAFRNLGEVVTRHKKVSLLCWIVLGSTFVACQKTDDNECPKDEIDEQGLTEGDAGPPEDVIPDAASSDPELAIFSTVGIGVSADRFCAEGAFTVTVQPTNVDGALFVIDDAMPECKAMLGTEALACSVTAANCVEGSDETEGGTVLLVILDDSNSMDDNDPSFLRSEACAGFISQLGEADRVAVTDFGHNPEGPNRALRTLQDLTSDRDAAQRACMGLSTGSAGTPIYGSVMDAVEVFLPRALEYYGDNIQFSVLLLSDGEPSNDLTAAEVALAAARDAEVPIFTVGLGPAADGADDADVDAIAVLQGLSEETGGAYASSADAIGLDALFGDVATAVRDGRCQLSLRLNSEAFASGASLTGEVSVSQGEFSTDFSFMVPSSELEGSKCQAAQ